VWSQTFEELDGNPTLYSDDFSRQTIVGCLRTEFECVALGFFHFVDFNFDAAGFDSYFKVWPETALAALVRDGKKVVVGSNITVAPEHRGDLGNGLQLKNLLLGLMVKTLLESDQDVMTGTMRCNRGMHNSAYQFGATRLDAGILHHGVEVDLVAFYRRQIAEEKILQDDLAVERLWRSRLDFREANQITQLNQNETEGPNEKHARIS
jgi:hypothetical protein